MRPIFEAGIGVLLNGLVEWGDAVAKTGARKRGMLLVDLERKAVTVAMFPGIDRAQSGPMCVKQILEDASAWSNKLYDEAKWDVVGDSAAQNAALGKMSDAGGVRYGTVR